MSEVKTYNPLAGVAKTMTLYDQEIKNFPALPDPATLLLRARLVFEEALEFVEACGCFVTENPDAAGEFSVIADPFGEPNLVEYADATGDLKVVVYGADLAAGIPAYDIYEEITRSNLSKVWPDGTIHKREDGKVLKPDTYSPADVAGVLERYKEALIA